MAKGSLFVVGSGFQVGHITLNARTCIEKADVVYYLVDDPVAVHLIESLNDSCISLKPFYSVGKGRLETYHAMADELVSAVTKEQNVCVVFYGHPGIFVDPSHRAIRKARELGFHAAMLPGISAEDCLFADLGVDPSVYGCQSYEATDFLVLNRIIDPSANLVLWQVGVIGDATYQNDYGSPHVDILLRRLLTFYPGSHKVTLYETNPFPTCSPRIDTFRLDELGSQNLTSISTLYIPPSEVRPPDFELLNLLKKPGSIE